MKEGSKIIKKVIQHSHSLSTLYKVTIKIQTL